MRVRGRDGNEYVCAAKMATRWGESFGDATIRAYTRGVHASTLPGVVDESKS